MPIPPMTQKYTAAKIARYLIKGFLWDRAPYGRYWKQVYDNLLKIAGDEPPPAVGGLSLDPPATVRNLTRLLFTLNWRNTSEGFDYWAQAYARLHEVEDYLNGKQVAPQEPEVEFKE